MEFHFRWRFDMAQYAIRTIIALIGFVVFIMVVPLLLGVLGLNIGGDALQLIKICAGIIALCYIVWGPTIPRPA
jgi:hypothetical protein